MKTMNAITAEILIKAYYTAEHIRLTSVAHVDAYNRLVNTKLIKDDGSVVTAVIGDIKMPLEITGRGRALVDHWLSTPLPEPSWRIPTMEER